MKRDYLKSHVKKKILFVDPFYKNWISQFNLNEGEYRIFVK